MRPPEPPAASPRGARDRGGSRRCGRCPRGCSRRRPRSAARLPARPAPSRSPPRHRPSRGPRRLWRSAPRRRASRHPARPRGRRSPTCPPRRRSWSRRRGTRPRRPLWPSPRPTHWEAEAGHLGGAVTAADRTGPEDRLFVKWSFDEPTPSRLADTMRVFLAGATGVIGVPLVSQLLDAGHEVTAMTRSVLRAAQLEAAGVDPVVCDVLDGDGLRRAVVDAAPDAVIHQLTSLPTRIDWGDAHVFDANNRVRTEGTRLLVE